MLLLQLLLLLPRHHVHLLLRPKLVHMLDPLLLMLLLQHLVVF